MSKDPYRYFRVEARELCDGLGQGVLELERGSNDPELVPRLLRLAHTLKGAARVVKALRIADAAHAMEEILSPRRDGTDALGPAATAELLALVDEAGSCLAELAPAAAADARASSPPQALETFQTVRVEIEEMEALRRAVNETKVQLAGLRRDTQALQKLGFLAGLLSERLNALGAARSSAAVSEKERSLAAELESGIDRLSLSISRAVERVDQELEDVRDGVDRLRLVPVATLLPVLERAARDAAQTLENSVQIRMTGGALRLDAHVLGPLRDALLQLVRNAVVHGIERPEERARLGKPERGSLRLEIERSGQRVTLALVDDGRGIDFPALRRKLAARGVTDADGLSNDAVLGRMLSGGLSTAGATTQLAGRGIGLDLVREVAQRLRGELKVTSEQGSGTRVAIEVPAALASVAALLVEAGGVSAAIPLDSVRRTLRVAPEDVARSAQGDSIAHEGRLIPFLPLSRALRQRAGAGARRAGPAIVVGVGERVAAVGVDRLRGTSEIVVRALPEVVHADPIVAGTALDAEGAPELVLDTPALLAAAERSSSGAAESAPAPRLPILVIDDSLTTRMLEQSILESAGYAVDLAVSAEQGLEKARARRYGVFIVDVEMPGMDGFEFVTRTRADPVLSAVPAVLVTSRNDPEDLARGERAGASAYIVKGEFEQNRLLGIIGKLLG